jgi:hypothetical protein
MDLLAQPNMPDHLALVGNTNSMNLADADFCVRIHCAK